jgi:hypothetical protein
LSEDGDKIDKAVRSIREGNADLARQIDPKRAEREPLRHQVELEKEGRSSWSGGGWGRGGRS